ncbi:MAG: DUF2007 domain-containing protein [Alphaproteobacteria bacterium]|nr:DUF2007 domain-containing protein [Alphaproteobacteria bacterium]
MLEVLRSNDPVLLSYAGHLLAEAGIAHRVFDAYTSAVEGSIGAIPRRLIVSADDAQKALAVLSNASLTIPV